MRSLHETHLKIYFLPLSYPPIFKKSGGHHTKVRFKNYVHKIEKLVLFLDHGLDIRVGFLWARYQ